MKPAPSLCPMCHGPREAHPKNSSFPFCGPRCKLADLGNWLSDRYAVATELDQAETEAQDEEPPLLH